MPIYWTLKAILKREGLSAGALAARAGLHRQSLYAILKNPKAGRIEGETLDALCEHLHCKPGDLLSRDRPR